MSTLKNRLDKVQTRLENATKPEYDPEEFAKPLEKLLDDIRAMFDTLQHVDRNKPEEEQERRIWDLHDKIADAFRKVGIHVPGSAELK